jgi:hypothetical protein
MIFILAFVDFWTTRIREKTTDATRPVYKRHNQSSSGPSSRYEKIDAHLDGEEEGEKEGSHHLEEIGPRFHPPEKQDFMWCLGEN